ncbi:hypothetical protein [Agrococcus baldri]|uniref:Uncharacterized protein n=1 Tax=Agrococcus baldri TaxID=153730 RepID=A0AA87USY4_9MICO|nr:hypothetical protein [Agrococcus baldri]GEK81343.1 hypothetical protein ABA31_26940 [Agrococcus baldri]
MSQHRFAPAHPAEPDAARGATERIRPDRLTIAAGIALLVIMALHTAVFVPHEWWGAWLAGPFRAEQPPVDATVLFWALPGGFVVPGALLALLIVREGRRGRAMPAYVAVVLAIWAVGCVWIVGPSGFLTLVVPVVLLVVANVRARTGHRGGARGPSRRAGLG